jgi:hypothetical protein
MTIETASVGLPTDTVLPLLLDAVRIVHLAAMAVGLGTAVFADYTILARIARPYRRSNWRSCGERIA